MVVAAPIAAAPLHAGDGQQEQEQAYELQEQRPGITHFAAGLMLIGSAGLHPEVECGNNFAALGAVEQIEGGDEATEGTE